MTKRRFLRGVYPELVEGLRMTPVIFRMDKNQETDGVRLKAQGSRIENDYFFTLRRVPCTLRHMVFGS
jgi:hypothetical protein